MTQKLLTYKIESDRLEETSSSKTVAGFSATIIRHRQLNTNQ